MPDIPLLSKEPLNKRLLILGIGTFIIFILLFLIYNRLFWTIPRNSDGANLILEAASILHGNLILKGWSLPPDNLWTFDIPIAALLMAIRGFTPSLMDNVPAIIYAMVVTVCLILVKNTVSLRDKWPNMIISLLIIGFPSVMLASIAAAPGYRIILYFLVALLAMERIRSSRLICLAVFLLLTLAYIGDPFTLYIFLAPLIIFLCIRWYYEGRRLDDLSLIASTIAVIPATKLVLLAVKTLGGFYSYPAKTAFVTFEGLSNNISLTIHGILSLFGVDFFGQPLMSRVAIESLVRIPALLLVCYFVYRTIKGFINHSTKYDAISEILSLSIAFDLLAYIFSNNAVNLLTTCYLIPVIVFGAIIVGRQLAIPDAGRVKYLFLIGLFGAAYIFFLITRITAPIASSPTAKLEAWLTSHHYKYGYGGYWDASIVTVETDNNVRIRQVVTTDNGQYVAPFNWLSRKLWYKSYPANFLVYDDSNWDGGVNMANAVNTFGQPTKVEKIENFNVLTWDKNITPELHE